MMNLVKRMSLKFIAYIIVTITVFTVNSACLIALGQDEEPESLKRLKRQN